MAKKYYEAEQAISYNGATIHKNFVVALDDDVAEELEIDLKPLGELKESAIEKFKEEGRLFLDDIAKKKRTAVVSSTIDDKGKAQIEKAKEATKTAKDEAKTAKEEAETAKKENEQLKADLEAEKAKNASEEEGKSDYKVLKDLEYPKGTVHKTDSILSLTDKEASKFSAELIEKVKGGLDI